MMEVVEVGRQWRLGDHTSTTWLEGVTGWQLDLLDQVHVGGQLGQTG